MLKLWGKAENTFIAITLISNLAWVIAPDRVLSMGQLELFDT